MATTSGKKKRMSQADVIAHFAEKFELKRSQVKEFFEELNSLAGDEVRRSGEFQLPGIGKLVLSERKARVGRNPQTGGPISIPSKTTLKMRLSKSIKETGKAWGLSSNTGGDPGKDSPFRSD